MKKSYLSTALGTALAITALPSFASSVVLTVRGTGATSNAAQGQALVSATTACSQAYRGLIYGQQPIVQTVDGGVYSVTMYATCQYTGTHPDISSAIDFLLD